jgi:hypothetical protein
VRGIMGRILENGTVSLSLVNQVTREIMGAWTERTLTLALDSGSTSGISSPTIEIVRDTLIELINKRRGDGSEDIKNSIRDSILSVYTG